MALLTDKYPELRESAPLNAQNHPELSHLIESKPLKRTPINPKPWSKQRKRPKRSEVTNATDAARISEKCEEEFANKLKTPRPTTAPGGSVRKLEELARRFASGQELWHEQDSKSYESSDEEPTSTNGARK